ncbi:MAG: hypothetical protein GY861_14500 [bacterium]|nr:hypothetical protein [bacterium]
MRLLPIELKELKREVFGGSSTQYRDKLLKEYGIDGNHIINLDTGEITDPNEEPLIDQIKSICEFAMKNECCHPEKQGLAAMILHKIEHIK